MEDELFRKKNVVGVGLGQKWTKGRNTGEDAILVFVDNKQGIGSLRKDDMIPSSMDGIKTDVVGRTGVFSAQGLTQKVRPLRPGYSCSHGLVTAGTIGGFFKDRDGQVVGLSNNHVVAASNRGRIMRDRIYQPGTSDANPNGNHVGVLKRYRTLSNYRSYNAADRRRIYGYNVEDSGIFYLNNPDLIDTDIPSIGSIAGFNDEVSVGQTLQKTGRTTGHTSASVIAVGATVNVSYGRVSFRFRDQIVTNFMSQGGDSGSLTLDTNRNIVGLLFAGSNTMTLHNRIRYPRATYGLSIYNPVSITEESSYILTVDGQVTANSFTAAESQAAIDHVRSLAKQGKDASITFNFSANPGE